MKGYVLLVEDDDTFASFVQTILEDEGYHVRVATNGLEGGHLLVKETFDLVISDLKMPGKTGLQLFRETRQEAAAPPFIFLTAFGTVDEAVAAIKEGAVDFLTKPLAAPEALLSLVQRTIEEQQRVRELSALKDAALSGLPPLELVFAGQAMTGVSKLVHDVAGTTTSVMITGESGTGKELIARALHHLGARSRGPFVPINCAAIPENLLESELFGHEKGAFTGAVQARQGKFELARGGTLFLDEIGELPLVLQAKLLRVIQEKTFTRVGGNRELKADVRIVAATNRDLAKAVEERQFREDLFYRLNVFPISLPPLRDRIDALPLLVEFFLRQYARQLGKRMKGVEPEALQALRHYGWPGNVRELQNVIERGVILAQDLIRLENLPDQLLADESREGLSSQKVMKSVQRDLILKALQRHNGNRRLAAEELGISRRTLQYRLKELQLLD